MASHNIVFSLRKPKVFVSQILRHYLTKEGRFRKLFHCLIRIKEPCVRKYEGLTRSKVLGILQTVLAEGEGKKPTKRGNSCFDSIFCP